MAQPRTQALSPLPKSVMLINISRDHSKDARIRRMLFQWCYNSLMSSRRIPLAFLMLLLLPFFAFAQSTETNLTPCPDLSHNLSLGSRGSDVIALQNFFIAQNLLPQGDNTGYFGRLTKAAAIEFQTQQSVPSTGLVGPLTRVAIAKVCAGNQTVSQTTNQQVEQNVSTGAHTFYASPTTGMAPLEVQFTSTGSDSTRIGNTVIFGDGASGTLNPAPVCSGCNLQSTVSHSYAAPGTYTATLMLEGRPGMGIADILLGTVTITVRLP